MDRTILRTLSLGVLLSALTGPAAAQAPQSMSYEGLLTDASGSPMTGSRTLELNIYDMSTAGSVVYGPQIFPVVPLLGGRFNVVLGPADQGGRPLAGAFTAGTKYIGVKVDGGAEIAPRQAVLNAPYAFNGVPPGAILMWSGTLATVPPGWAPCDGTNGTPDLRNRFILGVNVSEDPGRTVQAQAPPLMSYQGLLTDAEGRPMVGSHQLEISVFDLPSGGRQHYSQTFPVVPLLGGRFNVVLGPLDRLGRPLDWAFTAAQDAGNQVVQGSERYIAVRVDGGAEMQPRQRVLSSAYAFNGVPQGAIIMWSGRIDAIPRGWALCDGSYGTPDLRSRFILGTGPGESPGGTGGSLEHDHAVAPHSHNLATTNPGDHQHATPLFIEGSYDSSVYHAISKVTPLFGLRNVGPVASYGSLEWLQPDHERDTVALTSADGGHTHGGGTTGTPWDRT